MKRKTKLIMTIASLSLAVALMAFGVYAASSASFNISQQVTFSCTDVFVNVQYRTCLVANSSSALTGSYTYGISYVPTNNTSGETVAEAKTDTGKTPLASLKQASVSSNKWKKSSDTNMANISQDVTLTDTNTCACIEIIITNVNANTDAKVAISAIPAAIDNTTSVLTVGGSNYTTANSYVTIAKNGGSITILCKRYLTDTSKSAGTGAKATTWNGATITIANGSAS